MVRNNFSMFTMTNIRLITTGPKFEIPMAHNTAVVWSLETNRKYRHKIVLDTDSQPPENEWLGVTFRTSSSYVTIDKDKGVACLNGK